MMQLNNALVRAANHMIDRDSPEVAGSVLLPLHLLDIRSAGYLLIFAR
jgi:hypothetical protein